MKYPDMNQYITFLFSLLTEFFATQPPRRARGRPRCYTDASLLVFHAAMALKGITALRAQQPWLVQHPRMLQRFRLPACPSHVTLSRRYAALNSLLRDFTEFVARRPATVALGFCAEAVYTAAGAKSWVCINVFRIGCVAVTGGDADERAAWVAHALCQAHSDRLHGNVNYETPPRLIIPN